MVKIGKIKETEEREKPKGSIDLSGLYLIESIFEREFILSGKLYNIDMHSSLSFFKPISELNDNEIDDALNQLSANRFTFLAAKADLQDAKSKLERKFKIWLSLNQDPIRKKLENQKIRSSEKVTDKLVFSTFLQDKEMMGKYNEYQDTLDFYSKQLTILENLDKILEQRGWFLKVWSENRLLIKRGKGRDSGI